MQLTILKSKNSNYSTYNCRYPEITLSKCTIIAKYKLIDVKIDTCTSKSSTLSLN